MKIDPIRHNNLTSLKRFNTERLARCCKSNQQDIVSFKGAKDKFAIVGKAGLGALTGGILGFCFGGVIGALVSAILLGGVGATEEYNKIKELADEKR